MWLRSDKKDRCLRSSGSRAIVVKTPKRLVAGNATNGSSRKKLINDLKKKAASVKPNKSIHHINNNNNHPKRRLRRKRIINDSTPDDCKENCWDENADITMFDQGTGLKDHHSGSMANNVFQNSKTDGIGCVNDAVNQFGIIMYDEKVKKTNSECSCNSSCIQDQQHVKCISECDSTTEFESEIIYPSTSTATGYR